MRRARRHAGLRLDKADNIQPETARKIGPAIVVGDNWHGFESAQLRFPFCQLCIQTREKCLPIGFVDCGIGRVDPRQCFKNVGGDGFGVLRIQPIMRVSAAMSMAVAGTDAHPAKLQHSDRKRSIDVSRAAAADLRSASLHQQAIDPQIVVEPDAHEQLRLLESQHVLRLGLIVLGVHVRRDETDRRDPIAAHGLGQAAQIGRGGHDLDAILRNSRRCQGQQSAIRNPNATPWTWNGPGYRKGREAAALPSSSISACRRWLPRCSSASGNGHSSPYRRSRRPGNPSPRWRVHRRRDAHLLL